MFERFTEAARRSVFQGRYQAGQSGSPNIETEHLLLGILRSDSALAVRVFNSPVRVEEVEKQIELKAGKGQEAGARKKSATSGDLPLSDASRRALESGAHEARRLHHEHVGTAHLLFGLFQQEQSLASRILLEQGVTASQLRKVMEQSEARTVEAQTIADAEKPLLRVEGERDLTAQAAAGSLGPLIGREAELDRVIAILSRRTRHNAAVIGEPGVGKTALIEGLAQRIAHGDVPPWFTDSRVVAIDAAALLAPRKRWQFDPEAILAVEGLFDLAKASGWNVAEAMSALAAPLSLGTRCVATGTPAGFRHTIEKAERLANQFETVMLLPPTEEQAAAILRGIKPQLEKDYGLGISEEAIAAAITASRRFLMPRELPDRALDLMDDAAAGIKLRCELKRGPRPADAAMGPDDIAQAVADRTGATPAAVKTVMERADTGEFEKLARDLAEWLPADNRDQAPFLAAHLAACSAGDAEKLINAIRRAKNL